MASTSLAKGQVDLLDCIEWPSVECLNEKQSNSYANALKQGYREDDGLLLESGDDEQLLLYIPFNQIVKLHSIVVKAPKDGSGPKSIKLYTNRQSMGFSNTTDFPPQQEFELTDEDLEGRPVPLKFVKFQNVRSLSIFIESNQGGEDVTKVSKISVIGSTCVSHIPPTVETTNMKDLKKVEHSHG